MSYEAEQKARIREWARANGTIRLSGDDPVDFLQRCEWAHEINIPYDKTTRNTADFFLRLVPNGASRFPLTTRNTKQEQLDTLPLIQQRIRENDGVVLIIRSDAADQDSRQITQAVLSEWVLEQGANLHHQTLTDLQSTFQSIPNGAQGLPLLAKRLGIIDEARNKPGVNTLKHSNLNFPFYKAVEGIPGITLPMGWYVEIKSVKLRIKEVNQQGLYTVTETYDDGSVSPDFTTYIPLERWAQSMGGIPNCLSANIVSEKMKSVMIAVHDLDSDTTAQMFDPLVCKIALNTIIQKNLFGIAKNILTITSIGEKRIIDKIVSYLSDTVFPEAMHQYRNIGSTRRLS